MYSCQMHWLDIKKPAAFFATSFSEIGEERMVS